MSKVAGVGVADPHGFIHAVEGQRRAEDARAAGLGTAAPHRGVAHRAGDVGEGRSRRRLVERQQQSGSVGPLT